MRWPHSTHAHSMASTAPTDLVQWSHHCSCMTFCAEIFGETSNHPSDSDPLQPRFGALWLLAFPKTKITFEREEISNHQWDSGKYDGAADGDWENCVRSQGAYFKEYWGIIVLCIMFPISCIFFNKCFYFSYYMAGYLPDRHHTFYMYIQMHTYKRQLDFFPSLLWDSEQDL